MSLLTASMAIVFFFGFATAQITAPSCSSTLTGWNWTFNSLGQDPCLMTAYMYSTCSGGSYRFDPLPAGYIYYGPLKGIDDRNLCECSTVGYSLISACAGCQSREWGTWSHYVANCTAVLPPSAFPNPIPAAIRIPQWALLDVTNENDWNSTKSALSVLVGDSPELGPGSILGPKSSSLSASSARSTSTLATSSTAVSSTATSNTATPTPVGGHSSNAGAIAGGIAGGIGAIFILVAALLFYLGRRRSQATSAPIVVDDSMGQVPWPMSGRETATSLPEMSSSPKLYDPSDPTTFPSKYEGTQDLPYVPARVTSSSSNNTLCTTAAMPGPNAVGYHGLPIV